MLSCASYLSFEVCAWCHAIRNFIHTRALQSRKKCTCYMFNHSFGFLFRRGGGVIMKTMPGLSYTYKCCRVNISTIWNNKYLYVFFHFSHLSDNKRDKLKQMMMLMMMKMVYSFLWILFVLYI